MCRHKEYRDWEQETIVWASRELNLNPLKGRLLATLYMMNPALEELVILRETTNLSREASEDREGKAGSVPAYGKPPEIVYGSGRPE